MSDTTCVSIYVPWFTFAMSTQPATRALFPAMLPRRRVARARRAPRCRSEGAAGVRAKRTRTRGKRSCHSICFIGPVCSLFVT
eukprot:1839570-Pleurochrysis_carterae.AAC.1